MSRKKIRKRWIKALLSGKYSQGRGALRNSKNKFCCLGVLCDLVDKTKWSKKPRKALEAFGHKVYKYRNDALFPSDSVIKKVNIKKSEIHEITDLNDEGVPFNIIAKRLKKLFK